MTDIVRVLRVLEYEGPRSWVEVTLAESAIKGCKSFATTHGPGVIHEATTGEMPVVLLGYGAAPRRIYHYTDCPANDKTPAEFSGPCDCDCDQSSP
jgi:hypothetical protein